MPKIDVIQLEILVGQIEDEKLRQAMLQLIKHIKELDRRTS